MAKNDGFVNGLRPTTRKPRDGRVSPIANTMAKSQPDAPKRRGSGGPVPSASAGPTTFRTSVLRGKKLGEY